VPDGDAAGVPPARCSIVWRILRGVRLEGSVCLVTGAASGIGRATAAALEGAGARVVAVDRTEADLAEPGTAARLAAEAGDVDVLVNNAGIGLYGRAAELDVEQARRVLAVDLAAPIELTRAPAGNAHPQPRPRRERRLDRRSGRATERGRLRRG
jgi:short-subunit dehydrogenase